MLPAPPPRLFEAGTDLARNNISVTVVATNFNKNITQQNYISEEYKTIILQQDENKVLL